MPIMRKWKLQWWSGSKNSQSNFMKQGYMLSFEGGTLLLREMMTMLRSKDVIHRGSASFCGMIPIPMLVIIPVIKKKALLLDSPRHIFCWACYIVLGPVLVYILSRCFYWPLTTFKEIGIQVYGFLEK